MWIWDEMWVRETSWNDIWFSGSVTWKDRGRISHKPGSGAGDCFSAEMSGILTALPGRCVCSILGVSSITAMAEFISIWMKPLPSVEHNMWRSSGTTHHCIIHHEYERGQEWRWVNRDILLSFFPLQVSQCQWATSGWCNTILFIGIIFTNSNSEELDERELMWAYFQLWKKFFI